MKILVIEDEADLRNLICETLKKDKFVVESAEDYNSALEKINDYDYDCVVLDIMLPGGSGLDILSYIRDEKKQVSVLIVSAKDSVDDKVKGLDLGADDYLAKPFHLSELSARIKSILRRREGNTQMSLSFGNVEMWPDAHRLTVKGEDVELNKKEFSLLYYFLSNPERVVNKLTLIESVWGDNIDQADNFDFIYSQIKNVKQKLTNAGADIDIKAVYCLVDKIIEL